MQKQIISFQRKPIIDPFVRASDLAELGRKFPTVEVTSHVVRIGVDARGLLLPGRPWASIVDAPDEVDVAKCLLLLVDAQRSTRATINCYQLKHLLHNSMGTYWGMGTTILALGRLGFTLKPFDCMNAKTNIHRPWMLERFKGVRDH